MVGNPVDVPIATIYIPSRRAWMPVALMDSDLSQQCGPPIL